MSSFLEFAIEVIPVTDVNLILLTLDLNLEYLLHRIGQSIIGVATIKSGMATVDPGQVQGGTDNIALWEEKKI